MDLRRVCFYFINNALASLAASDVQRLEWHHKKFYIWMKLRAKLASLNKLAPRSSEWIHSSAKEKSDLINTVNAASVNGEMVCRLGPHFTSMLKREVTPLELMLEDKLLYKYYTKALKWDRSSQQMGDLVKHFAHKNPRAKILEIGAGTGSTAKYILEALGTDDSGFGPLTAQYGFTDISSGFFEAAQEKFSAWKNVIRYRKLDIEQDPAKQRIREWHLRFDPRLSSLARDEVHGQYRGKRTEAVEAWRKVVYHGNHTGSAGSAVCLWTTFWLVAKYCSTILTPYHILLMLSR